METSYLLMGMKSDTVIGEMFQQFSIEVNINLPYTQEITFQSFTPKNTTNLYIDVCTRPACATRQTT